MIRDQKTSRGWSKGRGKGFLGGKISVGGSSNKGGLQFNQGSRVHIESLKLRTRCARCGVVGHWARECSSPPDDYAGSRSSAATSTGKSSAPSSLSGRSGFVHVSTISEENPESFAMSSQVFQSSSFCGVTTHGAFGLVDTAAQSGLIGEDALGKLEKELAACGLKVKRTNRKAQARGVGGEAKVREVIEIPLGLGGVNGVLEATVVAEDVPLLIPVRLLRGLRAVIDFSTETVLFRKHGTHTTMSILPSGHASVSITEFANGEWDIPREAQVRGMCREDFVIDKDNHVKFCAAAMSTVSRLHSHDQHSHFADGWAAEATQGSPGRRLSGDPKSDPSTTSSLCGMACTDAEGARVDHAFPRGEHARGKKGHEHGAGMAKRWIALWIIASCGINAEGTSVAGLTRAFEQTGRVGVQADSWSSSTTTKLQVPPRVPASVCVHPKESLVGAANEYQKEVWCQECHARWKVETNPAPASLRAVPKSLTMIPGTPSSALGTASPASSTTTKMTEVSLKCQCGLPATRLRVKKEGPTKGRHFFKCPNHICNYFAWDPMEMEQLKGATVKDPEVSPEMNKMMEEMEREDSVLMMQQALHEGARNMVGTVVEQAEARHQEVMESRQLQHQSQIEQMHSQLIWLTALARESRVEEVMSDPVKSQEVMKQAVELREKLMAQGTTEGSMQSQGPMPE